jgi:cytochrome c-type biogenesis protein CcmE
MPADLAKTTIAPGTRIRLGGLVEAGSVVRGGGSTVSFKVTDGQNSVPVSYTGILPDLFREGQGVVTEGAFNTGHAFVADTVLAKHDEKYMPKEVADRLKKDGVWKDEEKVTK